MLLLLLAAILLVMQHTTPKKFTVTLCNCATPILDVLSNPASRLLMSENTRLGFEVCLKATFKFLSTNICCDKHEAANPDGC